MELIVFFIAAIVVSAIVAFISNTDKDRNYQYEGASMDGHEESDTQAEDETDYSKDWRTNDENKIMETETQIRTRDLFLETLTKIGCQYETGEGDDEGRVLFAYQGESFLANTSNESIYVHLWDPQWEQVELYDIDEMSRMRKAINKANFSTAVTTLYIIDDASKVMNVHSKSSIPFLSTMHDLETYLRVELNEFFHAHQEVSLEMHKLREQEQHA